MTSEESTNALEGSGGAPRPADVQARIADAFTKMAGCARSVALYERSHPVLQEMIASTHLALSSLLAAEPTLVVAATDTYLALDSFPIEDGPGALSGFVRSLRERKIGELKLSVGLTEDEITDFAEALCVLPEDLAARGGMREELHRRKVSHIQVRGNTVPSETRAGADPADIYEEALILIEDALKAVQSGLDIPLPEIRAVVADSLHSIAADEAALLALAGIRSYDRYLSEHSVNVCILSMVLAKGLHMDASAAVELGVCAMLHDVGKVFVPDDIVKKPGKLTEEEWAQVRRHPMEGARALAASPGLPGLAATIALEHHAYCDGAGYPAFALEYKPHLLSRLVAIVDTYDALTTDRPYRERWTGQQAIAWMLYEAPDRYDRLLMAKFAAQSGMFPIGALVRLANGETGVVIGGSRKHPTRPTVKLVSRKDVSGAATVIDLSQSADPGHEIQALAQPVEVLLPYADLLAA